MIKCIVKITTKAGQRFNYSGMFKSTVDAAMDAANRFEIATISVKAS